MSAPTDGRPAASRVLPGPDAPDGLLALPWHKPWDGRADAPLIAVAAGYDVRWEREVFGLARAQGRSLLSVRATPAEILIGPLWTPDGTSGCAGCAQARDADREPAGSAHGPHHHHPERHPAAVAVDAAAAQLAPRPTSPVLTPVLGQLLAELTDQSRPLLASGELLSLTPTGVLRLYRVAPSIRCTVCTDSPGPRRGDPAEPPSSRTLRARPTASPVPDRGEPPFQLDPEKMRDALADPRFGPVLAMQRAVRVGMAMTETRLLGARFAGHGRGSTFRHADAVSCLEAFERNGGFPHVAPVVSGATARQLGDRALPLDGLGHYTARQLDSPQARLRPFDEDTPMDWVWGHRLDDGRPLLVPAELGFYQYQYPDDPDAPEQAGGRHFFHDTSSGCALGGSYEEATLHSLLELAERDAFLLSWHRRLPLPRIAAGDITDRECLLLLRQVKDQGYQVHLLAATADLSIPVVWALALREDGRMPATLSAAGSGADPMGAVRAGLWELSQMVGAGADWDVEAARPLVNDPWLVQEMSDHHKRYAYPELLPRVQALLGGPTTSLAEAFPGWPGVFTRAAQGDLTQALRFVEGLFRQAGLDRIVVVDQSTPEHTAAGLSVVKAVVPGILPMCFGQARQRLSGLPRLTNAIADAHGAPPGDADLPLDPHPFP
ncbi:hypothetical protein DN069_07825 [Streptacidiphilus pinicola]|uniref:YcaO domain-containing protein n=1 Tax=Streptacidiphilus pinicola TaxID=2219663 RepID=A0A2X0KGG6_9ACTN|nr:TOMM precursor leader peptide-binding protein [Streptacidiphilus pinicola]RAG86179.1 hypothetical protein DN069_07825 [Streptacidiphilus pinicola]